MSARPGRSRKIALSLSQDHSAGPLSYLEMGQANGPCIVFIHGFGANLLTWQFCLVPLAARYRVVALDLPGHGRSTAHVGAGDVDFMVDWLSETFDLLNINPAHIVAHSMGAKIVLAYNMREPARIASLSLIAPAGLGGEFHHDRLDRFLLDATPANAEAVARQLLGANSLNLVPSLTASLQQVASHPGRNEALQKLLGHAKSFGISLAPGGVDWSRLACPIKILWGDQDRIIPLPEQKRLPPHSPVQVIRDTGHLPHMEASQIVVSALRDFLS